MVQRQKAVARYGRWGRRRAMAKAGKEAAKCVRGSGAEQVLRPRAQRTSMLRQRRPCDARTRRPSRQACRATEGSGRLRRCAEQPREFCAFRRGCGGVFLLRRSARAVWGKAVWRKVRASAKVRCFA